MKRVTLISLALFVLLIATAESSFACSCPRSLKPLKTLVREEYANSTAIFSGEVVEIKLSPTTPDTLAVRLKVLNTWKGKPADEITLSTPRESAMCGYGFVVGNTYLVYATGAGDDLMTTNCSRTGPASDRQDMRFLDKLKRRKVRSG